MNQTLEILLSFVFGFWFSSQFREKEFEWNNDLMRKLLVRKKKKDKPVEEPESAVTNDSPFNQ